MLTETLEAPIIVEAADASSPHLATLRGRFLREGARSQNKRIYENIAPWIERAQHQLEGGALYDMRTSHAEADGHAGSALSVVGRITKLGRDGTFEGTIPRTQAGQDVKNLLEGGYIRAVSLRARGATVEPLETEAGWVKVTDVEGFCGIDFTSTPGIADASVALAESADGERTIESFAVEETFVYQSEVVESAAIPGKDLAAVSAAAAHFEREYTAKERRKAGKEGAAMPDGSFPIYTAADVDHAATLWAHSPDPQAAKAHIIARAKELGLTAQLPYSWTHTGMESTADTSTISEGDDPVTGISDAIDTAAATNAAKASTVPAGIITGGISEAIDKAAAVAGQPLTTEQLVAAISALPAEQLAAVRSALTPPAEAAPQTPATTEAVPASAPPASLDVNALVAAAVEAALAGERSKIEETVTAAVEKERQSIVEAVLSAKRKTAGIVESGQGAEAPKLSLGEALEQALAVQRLR